MTETSRIRWESTGSGSFTGYVGALEPWVFYIHRPVLAGQRWMLTATLPGALDDVRPGTPDKLKAEAERWLEQFVSSLGAVFRDGDGNLILRYEESGGRYKILPVEEC
jgi:hypothetical protein